MDKTLLLENARQDWFEVFFYLFCLSVLIVNGGFLWKARQVLKQYKDEQFPDLLIKGQYAFLVIIVIWLGAFLLSFLLTTDYNINLNAYHYAMVSFAFLAFSMAFLALIRPASFYFLNQTFDSSETFVLQQIADSIMTYLQENTPYLDSQYSLQDLSIAVQSNPVLTSKAINRILKTNYNELMNELRVKHFIQLAQEGQTKNLTLWAIAQEAGFGNKATFYKAFKKNIGTTPKAYLSSIL